MVKKTDSMKKTSSEQSTTIAIIAYITILGALIALILNHPQKSKFASFHVRQGLLLGIVGFILSMIPLLGWIIAVVLMILGIINAYKGEEKTVPFIGSFAQDWFKGL
jgi:uncharacterized membrane protein